MIYILPSLYLHLKLLDTGSLKRAATTNKNDNGIICNKNR